MAISRRMQHPYPNFEEVNWYESFKGLISSLDAADFAAREDRNISIISGVVSVSSAGQIEVSDGFKVFHPNGHVGSLSGVIATLSDGQMAFVDVTRSPNADYALSVQTSALAPLTNNSLVIAARSGSLVWVRGVGTVAVGSSSTQGAEPAYAGLVATGGETGQTIGTLGALVEINQWNSLSPVSGMTYSSGNQGITIVNDGVYRVSLDHIDMGSNIEGVEVLDLVLVLNGSPVPGVSSRILASASSPFLYSRSLGVLIELSSGDEITVGIQSPGLAANRTIDLLSGSLSILRAS